MVRARFQVCTASAMPGLQAKPLPPAATINMNGGDGHCINNGNNDDDNTNNNSSTDDSHRITMLMRDHHHCKILRYIYVSQCSVTLIYNQSPALQPCSVTSVITNY